MPENNSGLGQVGADLVALIVDEARAVGVEVRADLEDAKAYAAERAEALAAAVGEPGFDEAILAERDNVVLRVAVASVDRADAVDARVLSTAAGALRLAAVALATVL